MKNTIKLQLITPNQAQEALAIYAYYVSNTSITFETVVPSLEEFDKRIEDVSKNYPWLVCMQDGKMVAYAFAKMHRPTGAYLWSPEVTIYVAHDFQGKGVGKRLYEALFAVLKLQGFYTVFAGVVLPNSQSIGLHKAMGFEEIGVFKNIGYKQGQWHSAQWFQKSLDQTELIPKQPKSILEISGSAELKEILGE
jgi:phosphinothricin acetyltransferase